MDVNLPPTIDKIDLNEARYFSVIEYIELPRAMTIVDVQAPGWILGEGCYYLNVAIVILSHLIQDPSANIIVTNIAPRISQMLALWNGHIWMMETACHATNRATGAQFWPWTVFQTYPVYREPIIKKIIDSDLPWVMLIRKAD